MSGHNKWSSIKHKKAATDAKRGKLFSRLSKELIMATKLGGKDPEINIRLRTTISSARMANMPFDKIERAIKKGAGEGGRVDLEELSYEGYAPGGVAILVECVTDNHNRSASEIRNIFKKANGNLTSSGSVSWQFQRKVQIVIRDSINEDTLMELTLDKGIDIDDIQSGKGTTEIIAPPAAWDTLLSTLDEAGIVPVESAFIRIPDNDVEINDLATARQCVRLITNLENYEDVQQVYTNASFADALVIQLHMEG